MHFYDKDRARSTNIKLERPTLTKIVCHIYYLIKGYYIRNANVEISAGLEVTF